jgi:hypothetical protein
VCWVMEAINGGSRKLAFDPDQSSGKPTYRDSGVASTDTSILDAATDGTWMAQRRLGDARHRCEPPRQKAGGFPGRRYLYSSAELANTSGIVILDCPPVTSTRPLFSRVAV